MACALGHWYLRCASLSPVQHFRLIIIICFIYKILNKSYIFYNNLTCFVQVLLPMYDTKGLVALVLHNGERTVGRCMLRLHGLLPLLLRQYNKSLLLFRCGCLQDMLPHAPVSVLSKLDESSRGVSPHYGGTPFAFRVSIVLVHRYGANKQRRSCQQRVAGKSHMCKALTCDCVWLCWLYPADACSPDRDSSGARIMVGSVQLQLSAAPTPDSSMAQTLLQLASAFVITPHTLNLHSSAVATVGRAERDAAVGGVVHGWMAGQGQAGVSKPLMQQVSECGLVCGTTAACQSLAVQQRNDVGRVLHVWLEEQGCGPMAVGLAWMLVLCPVWQDCGPPV